MKYLSVLLSCIFFLIVWTSPTCGEEIENKIQAISFHDVNGESERVHFHLTGRVIPDIFIIGGEKPRLVLDFFNTGVANIIANVTQTSGVFVKKIRMGRHSTPQQKTRIALDLVPGKEYEFQKIYKEENKVFEITIFQIEKQLPTSSPEKEEKKLPTIQETIVSKEPKVHHRGISPAEKPLVEQEKNTNQPTLDKELEIISAIPSKIKNGFIKEEHVHEKSQASDTQESDAKLLEVMFENTSNKGEMILFKLNGFYPPIVFGVEKGEPRVVCDFLDTQLDAKVPATIPAKGRYVKTIRVAKHTEPAKVRTVLNLVANKNYDLQQVFFKEDNLFVLIINTLETVTEEEQPK